MAVTKYGLELAEDGRSTLVAESFVAYEGTISSPEAMFEFCTEALRLDRKAEEHAYMVMFDSKLNPIGCSEVSHGVLQGTFMSPREILVRALLCGAASFSVIHNHPSGNPSPSGEDKETTKRLKNAGDVVGVSLIDHLIVGRNNYYSFCENGSL